MILNLKKGEKKTARLAQNAIGGISGYIYINGIYNINVNDLGISEKGDSVKVFNWSFYDSVTPSHSLLTLEQISVIKEFNASCNIPENESYQGIEEYNLTRTGRSTVAVDRLV